MFKILVKSLENPFWIFQAFEIFTKEIFSKNSRKIRSCQIWYDSWSWQVSCHGELYNPMKSPQNHFCPFWSLSNFTLPNMSKCSQTLWTFSSGLIIHLDQMAQAREQVNLIKVPQNPLWPESNLNNFVLPTSSPWPNFGEHVHMTKWGHYSKWCIKEKWFAQLDLHKFLSANF